MINPYQQAMDDVKSRLIECSDFLDTQGFSAAVENVLAMARLVFEREARYREEAVAAENHAAWQKMDNQLASMQLPASRVSGSAQ